VHADGLPHQASAAAELQAVKDEASRERELLQASMHAKLQSALAAKEAAEAAAAAATATAVAAAKAAAQAEVQELAKAAAEAKGQLAAAQQQIPAERRAAAGQQHLQTGIAAKQRHHPLARHHHRLRLGREQQIQAIRLVVGHGSPPQLGQAAATSPRRALLLRVAEEAAEDAETLIAPLAPRSPRAPPPASAEEAALYPDEGAGECVVCFEPLLPPATPRLAALEASLPPGCAPPRSALPLLPCAHACCAACLAAHLAIAAPRALRARPRAAPPGGQPLLEVRCPGLIPHSDAGGDGGWDLRCGCALPQRLLAPWLPPDAPASFAAAAHGDDDARSSSSSSNGSGSGGAAAVFASIASAAYLWARTRPCPHCGAPSERVEGCRWMLCASCARDWCWACGGGAPSACACAQRFSVLDDMEAAKPLPAPL
jgi:hypothetical protein